MQTPKSSAQTLFNAPKYSIHDCQLVIELIRSALARVPPTSRTDSGPTPLKLRVAFYDQNSSICKGQKPYPWRKSSKTKRTGHSQSKVARPNVWGYVLPPRQRAGMNIRV
jgi:hypothetical protein